MNVQGRHFVDGDGKPVFWLADTAWNLWCKGVPEEWETYLDLRQAQGFNVIQFVAGWWRGCTQPVHGRPFDLQSGNLRFDEAAMRSLDDVFAAIEARGLTPAPIMLWAIGADDPGQALSESQCVEVAQAQLARWSGRGVAWMLAGDGNYTVPETAERWNRIGRAAFAEYPDEIATMHPCGCTWVGDLYAGEPWYRFAGIQSGHGASDDDLRFLVDGHYARSWRHLDMPFVNLEPNYEDTFAYNDGSQFTAYHVRRASYWSLLSAPPAGVTYGISSIWMWARSANEIAENHENHWVGRPWQEDMATPGVESMQILKRTFESLPWTALRPSPDRLLRQPGREDLSRWQVAATDPDGSCAVIYCPTPEPVRWEGDGLTWTALDPATGQAVRAEETAEGLRAGPTQDGDVLFIGRC